MTSRNAKANKARKGGKRIRFNETVKAAIKEREWEFFSTNAEVLHEYERKGNDLCEPILTYRGYQTLYGTFVKPLTDLLDDFGRVHGSYWVHGTVTESICGPMRSNISRKS